MLQAKAAAADEEAKAAAKAAKEREKLLKAIVKEGGKKGVEIEGASDMGGLDFFCTTLELPEGDMELLQARLRAAHGCEATSVKQGVRLGRCAAGRCR